MTTTRKPAVRAVGACRGWGMLAVLIACGGDGGPAGADGGPDRARADVAPEGGEDGAADAGGRTDAGADAGPAGWPDVEYQTFFDNDTVATVHIDFDPEFMAGEGYAPDEWLDLLWDRWFHCGPYDNYVPVTWTYRHPDLPEPIVLAEVGLRLRGAGERAARKGERAGFKVHPSALLPDPEPGQPRRRIGDMNRINLLSQEGDESVMLQCMAYRWMREAGVPAPRCNHLRVFVQGEYYGLMPNVEEPDDRRYMRHRFQASEGTLYEAAAGCGFYDGTLDYLGPSFAEDGYGETYDVVRGSEEDAGAQLVPMLRCADPDETPDDGEFAACIQEWIDLDRWLRLIAAEMTMPSLESLSGAARNFYLLFMPDEGAPRGGRFLTFDWDHDHATKVACRPTVGEEDDDDCDIFAAVPIWHYPNQPPTLVDRLREVFRDRFCAAVEAFLDDVYTVESVDELAAAIEDAMTPGGLHAEQDPYVTPEQWLSEVENLRYRVEQRREQVRAQIEGCN